MTEPSFTQVSLYKSFLRRFPIILAYLGSTGSLALNLGSQLLTFVLLARSFGEVQFGHLMAITAATQIAMSLCGLGAEEPMIRRLVRDAALYPILLGHNLILIASTGIGLTLICAAALYFTVSLPIPFHEYLIIISIFCLSNIVLFQIITLTEIIFLARHEYMRASGVSATFAIARALTALLATWAFKVDSLQSWAFWHGGVHVLGALGCVMVLQPLGAPRWRILRDEIPRGIHIIISNFLDTLRQNVDTLVLNSMTTPAIVGNYGAASRIVQASLMSVWAFTKITYPRLVMAGAQGHAPTFKLATNLVVITAILGGLNSVGLFLLSPYIAILFGKGFIHMSDYLKILSWLVLLSAIQSVARDSLGAVEKHGLRALILNTGSVLGAALVVGLTYVYGVNGTFVAVYISQLISLAALWLALFFLTRRELASG